MTLDDALYFSMTLDASYLSMTLDDALYFGMTLDDALYFGMTLDDALYFGMTLDDALYFGMTLDATLSPYGHTACSLLPRRGTGTLRVGEACPKGLRSTLREASYSMTKVQILPVCNIYVAFPSPFSLTEKKPTYWRVFFN
jgi:hypothetical protein